MRRSNISAWSPRNPYAVFRQARAYSLLALGLLAIALVACGSEEPESPSSTSTPTAAVETPTSSPTATPSPAENSASPTATPTPGSTSTPEPSPTITPTSAATPTADVTATPVSGSEMEIERQAKWGSAGDAAAPFMDLLSRIPDNDETGRGLAIHNPAYALQGIGAEVPGADSGSEAWMEFWERRIGREGGRLPPGVLMMWPTHLDRYVSAYPDLWDHLGFDGRVVEMAAGAYPAGSTGTGGGSHGKYEVAVGDFDPDRTAAAISGCEECPAPETLEHSGVSYYAWPGGPGDLRERTSPPLYDHVGRAPRLLVQEDAAYFSWEDGVIPEFIDTLKGHSPSLAEDQDMTMVIERLAELGAVGTMDVTAVTVSIEEATMWIGSGGEYSRSAETRRRAVTKAPLLKPFEMLGHGAALDDEGRFFLGIVALHQDEATAQENADRMEQRLKESAFDGRETSDGEYVDTPWSELIERVEMSADGAALMVKLYPRERGGVRLSHFRYESLFLHEAEGEE